MSSFERVPSGFPGFDRIVDNIRMGDNVVWQTDGAGDYCYFARAFAERSLLDGRRLTYVRFAGHEAILSPRPGLLIRTFDPDEGFENFTVKVHELISERGTDAFYIFDSLSNLQTAWASDLMMGNFFKVTCPYLFELNTVAFFGILRKRHSFEAVARVRDTTQLLLDVFRSHGDIYIQPLKVWNRYGSNMFTPHRLVDGGETARPLTDAVEAGRFYAMLNSGTMTGVDGSIDHFDRTFIIAGRELESGGEGSGTRQRLAGLLLGRDQRILELSGREFTTRDFLEIKARMIGSGPIGGKAAGLLLARKILENRLPDQRERMEPHDSFYVGADVFYAFLVHNGAWKLRLKQRSHEGFFTAAEELKRKIQEGSFPESLREQFRRMIDYFAQNPIIVRSSSLLEDGFGNAFAGKYESIFCVNGGSPELRLEALERAMKRVYASAMDISALTYRRRRGLDEHDEQMALLIQRVSGSRYERYFLPSAAGVGYSCNSYVWHNDIDPEAGMLRMVSGLGTRAVDRTDSDYPRLAALNVPRLTPLATEDDRARYSQRKADVLDLERNELLAVGLDELAPHLPEHLRDLICEHDEAAESYLSERGEYRPVYYCDCGMILECEQFVDDMRRMLSVLQQAYDYPVDIEFTVNFSESGAFMINLLQCRPLQIRGRGAAVNIDSIAESRTLFSVRGNAMGGSTDTRIDYVIFIDPELYNAAEPRDKYQVARTVGKLNSKLGGEHRTEESEHKLLLLGPGRWGTSSPELGVPVSFAEISNIAVIGEVSLPDAHIHPELSYGSHFFQDLVETGMFYVAIFSGGDEVVYRPELLNQLCDIFSGLLPEEKNMAGMVRVYDCSGVGLRLKSDLIERRTVCGIFS